MKEIKFRAKSVSTNFADSHGKWVYGYYFKTPLTDENSGLEADKGMFFLSDGQVRHCIATIFGVVYVIDKKTLGQYIGIKDKNNVEIYEGDEIKYWDEEAYLGCLGEEKTIDEDQVHTMMIEWNDDGGYFFDNELGGDYLSPLGNDEVYKEVIGNIYED